MKKIEDEDLKEVNGGFGGWALAGIALAVTFAAGIIDGQTKP